MRCLWRWSPKLCSLLKWKLCVSIKSRIKLTRKQHWRNPCSLWLLILIPSWNTSIARVITNSIPLIMPDTSIRAVLEDITTKQYQLSMNIIVQYPVFLASSRLQYWATNCPECFWIYCKWERPERPAKRKYQNGPCAICSSHNVVSTSVSVDVTACRCDGLLLIAEYPFAVSVSEQEWQRKYTEADGCSVPQRGDILSDLQHHLSTEVRGTTMGAWRTGKQRSVCGGHWRSRLLAQSWGNGFEKATVLRSHSPLWTL